MTEQKATQDQMGELASPEARLAAERSRAYRFFAEAFEYPDAVVRDAIAEGTLEGVFREILGASEPSLMEDVD